MPQSKNRRPFAIGIVSLVGVAGLALYIQQQKPHSAESDETQAAQTEHTTGSSSPDVSDLTNGAKPSSLNQGRAAALSENDATHQKLENSQLGGESDFTRAPYFTPVDWGTGQTALAQREGQTLQFKPACKTHPRAGESSLHPAQWAESFTQTDSLSRWPLSATHVIDWNQFWQVGDRGIQVSIRWNFEMPPRYNVVGYSFALTNPDGYGTSLWPDKPEMSWDEAKAFVVEWEKKTLEAGGKLASRTMSVAEKPFNPADVSTEEVERAEYHNSRVRAVQTGKMICNSTPTQQDLLSCSCWF